MKAWRIAARPTGRELRKTDFSWHPDLPSEPLTPESLRVRILSLSNDPAQKGWMENAGGYSAPTNVGDIVPATGVAQVIESQAEDFAPGDLVQGMLGWREEAVVRASEMERVESGNPDTIRHRLGVLGTTGLTAFFGLRNIGRPFPGNTMVVTGAAGGVGSIAGQLGKSAGCRVIGIAGGAEKCAWLRDELGFDVAIDYRAQDVAAEVRAAAPHDIDLLWDNVGGAMFDDLLGLLAMHARIVLCGGIARYEQGGRPAGPANYFNLIYRRASMEGLILGDHAAEFPLARRVMGEMIADGRLQHRDDVVEGLENAPEALMRVFQGRNIGKQILKVADPA